MENDLKILSQQIKEEADLVLGRTGLIGTLGKYGQVHVRGSYELDLMVDGDIDVYVVTEKCTRDMAVRLLNELIAKDDFRAYKFFDFVKKHRAGFPTGYYIGLKNEFDGRKWNIDMWLMESMDTNSDEFMRKVSGSLNGENREAILNFKKIIKDEEINLPSFVIYKAVIDGGVKTLRELVDFAFEEGFDVRRGRAFVQ